MSILFKEIKDIPDGTSRKTTFLRIGKMSGMCAKSELCACHCIWSSFIITALMAISYVKTILDSNLSQFSTYTQRHKLRTAYSTNDCRGK